MPAPTTTPRPARLPKGRGDERSAAATDEGAARARRAAANDLPGDGGWPRRQMGGERAPRRRRWQAAATNRGRSRRRAWSRLLDGRGDERPCAATDEVASRARSGGDGRVRRRLGRRALRPLQARRLRASRRDRAPPARSTRDGRRREWLAASDECGCCWRREELAAVDKRGCCRRASVAAIAGHGSTSPSAERPRREGSDPARRSPRTAAAREVARNDRASQRGAARTASGPGPRYPVGGQQGVEAGAERGRGIPLGDSKEGGAGEGGRVYDNN